MSRPQADTPSLYEGRPFNLYGYFDVAQAIAVRWLLKRGFEHADIRGALDSVRAEHPQWPLLRGPLGVGQASIDDRGLLVRKEGEHYIDVTAEKFLGFEWARYAIAWIKIDAHLAGIAVEHAKTNVVNRHAHQIVEQRRGDHFTYTRTSHYKHPPSLIPARK